jgi:hypothetical protein
MKVMTTKMLVVLCCWSQPNHNILKRHIDYASTVLIFSCGGCHAFMFFNRPTGALRTQKNPHHPTQLQIPWQPADHRRSLFINRPIQQQEDLTIEYGGPYFWQIFWSHLSLDQQRQIKIQYPDITFPPHWPQAIPSGHRNQKISYQLESDYSLAARNIYDDVLDTLDQQDEGDQERDDEDDRSTGAPSQETHPKPVPSHPATNPTATYRSPSPKKGKARPKTSIIAMLNPSRHIFRDWTPLPFSVHEDVGLEVGNEIIRKIAEAIGHPMPAPQKTRGK